MSYGQNPPYPQGGQTGMPQTSPPGPMPAKIDPTTAAYGPSDDPARSCSSCAHFDGVGACEIVDGQIRPDGVSDFWEPAQGAGGPPMGGMPLG